MSNNVTQAIQLIYAMDRAELDQVVEAVKLKRTHLSRQAISSIMIGDNVSFTNSRTGRPITGVITKVARKYATVRTLNLGQWRVPASMLTVIEEA
jgi:ribosomal protein L35AE/L33A